MRPEKRKTHTVEALALAITLVILIVYCAVQIQRDITHNRSLRLADLEREAEADMKNLPQKENFTPEP